MWLLSIPPHLSSLGEKPNIHPKWSKDQSHPGGHELGRKYVVGAGEEANCSTKKKKMRTCLRGRQHRLASTALIPTPLLLLDIVT